jgi:hypothetical protein
MTSQEETVERKEVGVEETRERTGGDRGDRYEL